MVNRCEHEFRSFSICSSVLPHTPALLTALAFLCLAIALAQLYIRFAIFFKWTTDRLTKPRKQKKNKRKQKQKQKQKSEWLH